MQQPTAQGGFWSRLSLGAIDPSKRLFIRAAVIGFLCANVATVLGGILYGFTALHEDLTAQTLGLFVYMTLSSEVLLLLPGIGAGVLSCVLLRRLGAVGGTLVAAVLVANLGGLVGYAFTWRAPHVDPQHAVLDLAAAWSLTALVALSVAAWRGAGRARSPGS